MDMLKVKSQIFRNILSRMLKNYIKKKTGQDIYICFDDIDVVYTGDNLIARVKAEVTLDNTTLNDIYKDMRG